MITLQLFLSPGVFSTIIGYQGLLVILCWPQAHSHKSQGGRLYQMGVPTVVSSDYYEMSPWSSLRQTFLSDILPFIIAREVLRTQWPH